MPKFIKLINENKICKKYVYPQNYEQFLEFVKEYVPIKEDNKIYELKETTAGRSILDKADFDLMTKELINEDCLKISVKIIDSLEKENNNLNENEINSKYLNSLKSKLKKKLDEYVDELFNDIEKNLINKKRNRENNNENSESEENNKKK